MVKITVPSPVINRIFKLYSLRSAHQDNWNTNLANRNAGITNQAKIVTRHLNSNSNQTCDSNMNSDLVRENPLFIGRKFSG